MSERFDYEVTIDGIPGVPLRTTKEGAMILMKAFDNGNRACEILLGAMKDGIGYKNSLIAIKKRSGKSAKKQK